jgi:hypothetical protein
MLPGFRSRWMMPAAWAAATASAIGGCIAQHLADPHPLAADKPIQRRSVNVLHHDDVRVALAADIVNGDDVRMVQRRGALRFREQPSLSPFVVPFVCGKNLQSHRAVEARVAGLVNDAHAAATNFFDVVEVEKSAF